MIGIIDMGMGNLRSVQMGFARIGAQAEIITSPRQVANANKLVLPGQGHFGAAMAHLRQQGLADPIVKAIRGGRPFLGICLGLQLLFDVGYEDGTHSGLGVLPGKVVRFDFAGLAGGERLSIPHMGWNQVTWNGHMPALNGVPQSSYFYFVHSYHVVPMTDDLTCVWTDYGHPFVSAVGRENLFACQFHPEKSQKVGLQILRNFTDL